ncbi:MAG: S-layer homology domain-containing protein [Nostoc sp.]|uniref:S-layer homology domain-containing protein n=1 Tax=Nostoc sp. TaxID=1180 RepID=UPI002FF6E817
MKPLLQRTFNFFLGSLTAKTFTGATAIILLWAFTNKPVVAEVPSFTDVDSDVYAKEIQEAVHTGFIVGFTSNNTFGPTSGLTREHMVSIVNNALSKLHPSPLTVTADIPPNLLKATNKPYRDTEVTRWSAGMIDWAKSNRIILGYSDGTFRPTQIASRAELIAVLLKAVQYGENTKRSGIATRQLGMVFSDISNHWAQQQIIEMSAYCGVASPLNETGNTFFPNLVAKRNYAAAATLRMLNCMRMAKLR